MTTAAHEFDLAAPGTTAGPTASAAADAAGSAFGAAPASESERSSDFQVEIAIQAIASRILAVALLERAQEAESIAT